MPSTIPTRSARFYGVIALAAIVAACWARAKGRLLVREMGPGLGRFEGLHLER